MDRDFVNDKFVVFYAMTDFSYDTFCTSVVKLKVRKSIFTPVFSDENLTFLQFIVTYICLRHKRVARNVHNL